MYLIYLATVNCQKKKKKAPPAQTKQPNKNPNTSISYKHVP